jgi:hypothetical protein
MSSPLATTILTYGICPSYALLQHGEVRSLHYLGQDRIVHPSERRAWLLKCLSVSSIAEHWERVRGKASNSENIF